MTLLKGNDYRAINIALLSLEADVKKLNKNTNFDAQLAAINKRIDEINIGDDVGAEIKNIKNDIKAIDSDIDSINTEIDGIEQKLANIFSAENKVTDFNTTTNSGIYYWIDDAANKPTDYGVLLVNKFDSGSGSTWINQIAYCTNNKIYFRQNINSGNWTAWKAVAFEGEGIATLTVNGKTYNGSEAVDAGVQTVANGGTGVTTQADINKAFIGNLGVGNDNVTDGTEFVSSYASDSGFSSTDEGSLHTPYKRQFIKVWNYIKGKISSVLGLTKDNYGGKAASAGFLANYASKRLASGNIKPKDASEYGGMRKDVVSSSMTDSGRPGHDGHLLTMFWDNSGRYDSQFFVSNNNSNNEPLTVKARAKANGEDYGPWVDIITSNNIGSQTVASAGTADSLFYIQGNEINFKGGTPASCYFNYRNADTGGPSPVDTMNYRFCNYSGDTSKSVITAGRFDGKANTAGTADKVASAGVSGYWIAGRANAICKTTVGGGANGWKTLASIKTSSGSIEIGNLSGEDFIRVVYSSDDDVIAGNNNVTDIAYIKRGEVVICQKLNAASAGIRIPIGAPSSISNGDIWIG